MDHMRRPSPARADLLREFMVSRFSSNQDAKAQGATTKRQKYFSKEALEIIKTVSKGRERERRDLLKAHKDVKHAECARLFQHFPRFAPPPISLPLVMTSPGKERRRCIVVRTSIGWRLL